MCGTSHLLRIVLLLTGMSIACSTLSSGVLAADTVRINGSGSGLEMIKPLVQAYTKQRPGVTFHMEKSLGSSGSLKALLAGVLDIAVISRPLKPEEAAQGARFRDYGLTPLVIVTHKDIPLKNITTQELVHIYSGKTTAWPSGETIRVILRPKEETDTKILRGLSQGMDKAVTKAQQRRGMLLAITDAESMEAMLKIPGSLGASSLTHILAAAPPVNMLSLNGIAPTPQHLKNKTYPLAKQISFATTGRTGKAAAEFLAFVFSGPGRALAENFGMLITAGPS